MAVWTAPTTRSTGALVSASIWNTDIVENLKYLKDSPVFDGDVTVGDDLFLGSGAVINIASGDVTITHSTNTLTFAGAASGYVFNDGVLTVSGFGTHSFSAGGTGENKLLIRNTTAGTGNYARLDLQADGSDTRLVLDALSSTYTTSGIFVQAGAVVQSQGVGGLSIAANNASGAIRFYTGGQTERMRLTSGGNLAIAESARLYLDGVAGTGDTYLTDTGNNFSIYVGNSRYLQISASTGVNIQTAGVVAGSATGGDKGVGTINVAVDVYKNNNAYTNPDYVFEQWATGRIERFAGHEGAATYRGLRPLHEVEAFAREHLALPQIVQWRQGQTFSGGFFGGSEALLASLEEAYLYLFALQSEIDALKARIH